MRAKKMLTQDCIEYGQIGFCDKFYLTVMITINDKNYYFYSKEKVIEFLIDTEYLISMNLISKINNYFSNNSINWENIKLFEDYGYIFYMNEKTVKKITKEELITNYNFLEIYTETDINQECEIEQLKRSPKIFDRLKIYQKKNDY